jgi:homoserine acetyltransferase
MSEIKSYSLGDFALQSGGKIPDAQLAYKTSGDSSNPAIIYPTWYSGQIADNEWLIGDDMAVSPRDYFIVVPALFGGGQSTSPSNRSDLKPFPDVTVFDNVKAQYQLVTKGLGLKKVRCVLGWSMGKS